MSEQRFLITAGASFRIAEMAKNDLLPEYICLYSGFNIPATLKELPLIVSGDPPAVEVLHTKLGSNDFSKRPEAIVLGSGYDDGAAETLMNACRMMCTKKGMVFDIPILRHSVTITRQMVEKGNYSAANTNELAIDVSRRLRSKLEEIRRSLVDRSQHDRDGVYFF